MSVSEIQESNQLITSEWLLEECGFQKTKGLNLIKPINGIDGDLYLNWLSREEYEHSGIYISSCHKTECLTRGDLRLFMKLLGSQGQ